MSKATLTNRQAKEVVAQILRGDSWEDAAYEFDFGYQTLRNLMADKLHLHVPSRRLTRKEKIRRRIARLRAKNLRTSA